VDNKLVNSLLALALLLLMPRLHTPLIVNYAVVQYCKAIMGWDASDQTRLALLRNAVDTLDKTQLPSESRADRVAKEIESFLVQASLPVDYEFPGIGKVRLHPAFPKSQASLMSSETPGVYRHEDFGRNSTVNGGFELGYLLPEGVAGWLPGYGTFQVPYTSGVYQIENIRHDDDTTSRAMCIGPPPSARLPGLLSWLAPDCHSGTHCQVLVGVWIYNPHGARPWAFVYETDRILSYDIRKYQDIVGFTAHSLDPNSQWQFLSAKIEIEAQHFVGVMLGNNGYYSQQVLCYDNLAVLSVYNR